MQKKKTKSMVISKPKPKLKIEIMIDNEEINQFETFLHLGQLIASKEKGQNVRRRKVSSGYI